MELDLITAIDIMTAVEKSPYYGSAEFLEKALGTETFVKYRKLGYIGGANNTTYSLSDRYENTRDSISRERRRLFIPGLFMSTREKLSACMTKIGNKVGNKGEINNGMSKM